MYEEFPEEQDKQPSRLRKPLYALVALLLVASLVLPSAVIIWLAERQPKEQAITVTVVPLPTRPPATIEGTAAATTVPEVATAVPTGATAVPTETTSSSGRIAFITPRGQVVTIASDGSDRRLLTEGANRFQFPAWSPDGRTLAVIGSGRSGGGVYLLTDEPGRPEPRQLYASRTQSPFYLYWSPDSQWVSFLANHPADVLGLHLASVDGVGESFLLTTGSPLYWHWTSSSEQVLIHAGYSGENARLEFIDATGGGPVQEVGRPGFFQAPGISATGNYLAYAETRPGGQSQLVIADTRTGDRHQERHAGQVALGWSPGGDLLAITSGAAGSEHFYGPLRLVDPASGDARLLSRETVLAFFWSPDGRYLAAISLTGRSGDTNAQLPGSSGPRPAYLAKSSRLPQSHLAQHPLPLTLNLSIIEAETGRSQALAPFEPTGVFVSQFLPFFDQYALSHRLWSPDSDALVLPMRISGVDRVVVIPIDGRAPLELADGDMPFWRP